MLFPVTIFLSAFLLFQLQPMMGRFVLPSFRRRPRRVDHVHAVFPNGAAGGLRLTQHWLGSRRNAKNRKSWIHIALLAGIGRGRCP